MEDRLRNEASRTSEHENERSAERPPDHAYGPFTELLKPADVARRLGVSRSWLYDAAKCGRVPHVRLGGADGPLRFVEADLLAWLAEARAAWSPGRGEAMAPLTPDHGEAAA